MLNIHRDESTLAVATAERIADRLRAAIDARGDARLCLTGGSTPRATYRMLARPPLASAVDWARVQFFWGDERHVPPDHPDSNFRMAREAMLAPLEIPDTQVHRIRAELPDPEAAAQHYEGLLQHQRAGRDGALFDVMLLGLGADAHIASIFPHSPLLAESGTTRDQSGGRSTLAAAARKPDDGSWRITLTPAALLAAGAILMMTAGSAKADAVFAALRGPADVQRWPAQLLRHASSLEWWMDASAARRVATVSP